MLIYRVESCVNLVYVEKNVNIDITMGPYNGQWLGLSTYNKIEKEVNKLNLNLHDSYTLETQIMEEFRSFLSKHDISNFDHKECTRLTHPAPWDDVLLNASLDYHDDVLSAKHYFGFGTIEQLKKWFDLNSRQRLKKSGYYVAIYETKDYHVGDTQCIFVKKDSDLVDFIDLGDLL